MQNLPEHLILGFLNNPSPTTPIDTDDIRDTVSRILQAVQTTCQKTGVKSVTVVAGGHTDIVATIIKEEARERQFIYRPGLNWGKPHSQFFAECDLLVLLSSDEGAWCAHQVSSFRRLKPQNMVIITNP